MKIFDDMRNLGILLFSIFLPLMAGAQAQINTKKVKIGDFTEKITKVVLTGNDFYDSSLKEEVAARWRISPYEFCSLDEFNALKTDDRYYFLITTEGQFKKEKEPALQFLSLVKGGKKAEKGINSMLEVVSIPLASAEDPSGREFTFLPVFFDIIQNYTLDAIERDIKAYTGLSNYTINISKATDMKLVFAECDLSSQITDRVTGMFLEGENITIADEDTVDSMIAENAPNTLISYVVAPSSPAPGSYCYKMLIDTQTYGLYYYRKHRITRNSGPGFLEEDIRRITAGRIKIH